MRPARRRWLAGAGALSAAAWAGVGMPAAAADGVAPAAVGQPLAWAGPVQLVDGRVWEPPGPGGGGAAVIVFWATWCGFCRRHNARLETLAREQRSLRVLGAGVDGDDAKLRDHARAQGWTFPITAAGPALRERWGLRRVVPLTLLVGADGRLRSIIPGELAEADIAAIPALLAPR